VERRTDLVAAALVYFEEALHPAAVEMEATHADLAAALRWMAADPAAGTAASLRSATDAIDDGLGVDEVIRHLQAAAPPGVRRDPVAYLRRRVRAGLSRR